MGGRQYSQPVSFSCLPTEVIQNMKMMQRGQSPPTFILTKKLTYSERIIIVWGVRIGNISHSLQKDAQFTYRNVYNWQLAMDHIRH